MAVTGEANFEVERARRGGGRRRELRGSGVEGRMVEELGEDGWRRWGEKESLLFFGKRKRTVASRVS